MPFILKSTRKESVFAKNFLKTPCLLTTGQSEQLFQKKTLQQGVFLADDIRGKHNKHQTDEDKTINEGIKQHIDSIPKVESWDYYLRANTSREFIEGGKSIADLHRDYVDECRSLQRPSGSYKKYNEIFTKEYNISVFVPKKDQCELCHAYNTAEGDEKAKIVDTYERHIMEKDLSQLRKESKNP